MAFSLDARTVHVHDQASCLRVPASSVLAFFLPRRSPVTLAAGKRRGRKNALPRRTLPHPDRYGRIPCCRLASCTDRAGRPDNRLSVWRSSRTPAPFTLYAPSVLNAKSRVHPSNERRPCGSPGGITATLSDWSRPLLPRRSRPSFAYAPGSDAATHAIAAAACFA